jgi:hypothetical protein
MAGISRWVSRSAAALLTAVVLFDMGAAAARAQGRTGAPPPVTYDNKYQIYGGLLYMNFKAGENLPKRMNLGGAEVEGTWWITPRLGVAADYRGAAGTTQAFPNAAVFGINRPLVYMNMGLGGVEWRGPKNQHAAVNYHALAGIASGVFDAETGGAGPTPGVSAASNAKLIGLYDNHTAPIIALGGSLDMNRSRNLALRLSPELILEHFGNQTREFFSISGGVVYRFPVRKK